MPIRAVLVSRPRYDPRTCRPVVEPKSILAASAEYLDASPVPYSEERAGHPTGGRACGLTGSSSPPMMMHGTEYEVSGSQACPHVPGAQSDSDTPTTRQHDGRKGTVTRQWAILVTRQCSSSFIPAICW